MYFENHVYQCKRFGENLNWKIISKFEIKLGKKLALDLCYFELPPFYNVVIKIIMKALKKGI